MTGRGDREYGSGDTHLSSGHNSDSISRPQTPDKIAPFPSPRGAIIIITDLIIIIVGPGPDDFVFLERGHGMNVLLQLPPLLLDDHVFRAVFTLRSTRDGDGFPSWFPIE